MPDLLDLLPLRQEGRGIFLTPSCLSSGILYEDCQVLLRYSRQSSLRYVLEMAGVRVASTRHLLWRGTEVHIHPHRKAHSIF